MAGRISVLCDSRLVAVDIAISSHIGDGGNIGYLEIRDSKAQPVYSFTPPTPPPSNINLPSNQVAKEKVGGSIPPKASTATTQKGAGKDAKETSEDARDRASPTVLPSSDSKAEAAG